MKELIKELRLLTAEKLLAWSMKAAPKGNDGDDIRRMGEMYFIKKLRELNIKL